MALLYGRPRVGKTHLLKHVWPEQIAFHFTAANTIPGQNRRQLIAEVARWTGVSLQPEDYPNWRTVFRMLLELKAPEPAVIILDEFHYLAADQASLGQVASELNAAWEQHPARAVVLVLSGSKLESLMSAGAPLHGRFAWHGELVSAGSRNGLRHLWRDTLPSGHAARRRVPCRERGAHHSLAAREVRNLLETAVAREDGLRESPAYNGILQAIGAGYAARNKVGRQTGMIANNSLRDRIERLVRLGYVEAQRSFDAGPRDEYRYRIADPAFMFYHEFVLLNLSLLGRLTPQVFWETHVLQRLDTYMGHVFDRIAEAAFVRAINGRQLPLAKSGARWEGKDRAGEPLEMDLVAALDDGRVLAGEVKWNREPLPARVLNHHMSMLERLTQIGMAWPHRARECEAPILFVAAGGFTEEFQVAARSCGQPVTLWTLRDLYGRRLSGAPIH